ncbi:MAG: shikimate dehydrogenase [Rhabdochlamydiaceae bacterium]|nr:shikimate dehydrogenase [Rhabdochlamydiaceae bacterium]
MLFTLITGPTYEKAHRTLQEALRRGVDGVEIRIDTFSSIDFNQIQSLRNDASTIQVLFTLRSSAQGGMFEASQKERLEWIEKLASLYPDILDLEYDVPDAFRSHLAQTFPTIKFMSSYHHFTSTPSDLPSLFASLRSPLTHIVKVATLALSTLDTLRMLDYVHSESSKEQLIGICMGDKGLATRVLGPVVGNTLDYTFLDAKEQTAPGQLSLDDLIDTYHYRSLNKQTRIYGVIGSPVNKSLGPIVHNAVFDQLKINASYLALEISPTDLSAALSLLRKLPFEGLSVTMPLKEAIIPFLDQITPRAKAIGAVNTIEIKQGKWIGHNTDGIGALNAIEKNIFPQGKKIIIIGAGGAAKAIAHEAVHRKANVFVLNRTVHKAQKLADELHCRGGGLDHLSELFAQGYDIIINCTPDAEPVPPGLIFPKCYAMDIVYQPKNTPFLVHAASKQCHLIYGYEMFLEQAVEQQIIWFSRLREKAQMHQIMRSAIQSHLI